MRSLRLAAAALCLLACTAHASPSVPQNGVEYFTLPQPQATQSAGQQVEVIEFFMYHCPVCNALEPLLEDWIKQEGARVKVRRLNIPARGPADPEAHLFLTLEALGMPDEVHGKIFNAVHVQHVPLHEDEVILDWVAKNGATVGVDPARFRDAWSSFGVQTRLRQLGKMIENYHVDSAPTLVVDGRWLTSPAIVGQRLQTPDRNELFKATLEVADKLVTRAAQSKQ